MKSGEGVLAPADELGGTKMKDIRALAVALVALAVSAAPGVAQREKRAAPVPLPGYTLTVQVIGPHCPPPAPGVKNTPPWVPVGQRINCTSAGGDCSEANIPAGTTVRLSTAPFNPTGSWSIAGGPVTPTPGTCGYSQTGGGHQDCEFTMPPHGVAVRLELPCPPPPATNCQDDLASGKLTLAGPTVSNVTSTSASLTGTVNVSPMTPGCTYAAKLVWGPTYWTQAAGSSATGTIPPPGPLALVGTATPLTPSSAYGARIEATKSCGGMAPTSCSGPTKRFETSKGPTGSAELCVFKFNDLDGDGVRDVIEPLLPGWTFNVNPGPPTQVTTGAQGGTCFGVSAPGTYTISEVLQPGWTPTTPVSQTITVPPSPTNVFFGNQKKVAGGCDLETKKSLAHMAQHPPFQAGQQVSFEIYVTNLGSGVCNAPVSVTESFSAGLTYVSGGTAGWICPPAPQGSPVICTYNQPIAPNQTSMFLVTFAVTGPPPGMAENCASVENAGDTNLANNRACIKVPLESPPKPDLTIKKSMSCPGPTTPQGIQCAITFTITNNGPGAFNGILGLLDVLTPAPASLNWAPPSGSTPPGWSCGIGLPSQEISCGTTGPVALAPQGSVSLSLDVYLPAGQYQNCGSVKGYTQIPFVSATLVQEVTFANNESCVPIQVGPLCKNFTLSLSTGQNPNWTVSPGAVGVITNLVPVSGIWVVPPGGVNWIQPAVSSSPQDLAGGIYYQYSVSIVLANPALYDLIQVTGSYAADNGVPAGVSMNGGPSSAPCGGQSCFSAWHPFTLSQTSAIASNNHLDVTVYNNPKSGGGPTPTGLVVDATFLAECKN